MCSDVGSARCNQFDVHALTGALTRGIAVTAALVALAALIALGGVASSVAGTTAAIDPIFEAHCFAVAGWSAVVTAGSIGVGLICDLLYSADKMIRERNIRDFPRTFFVEALITIGMPIVVPCALCCASQ